MKKIISLICVTALLLTSVIGISNITTSAVHGHTVIDEENSSKTFNFNDCDEQSKILNSVESFKFNWNQLKGWRDGASSTERKGDISAIKENDNSGYYLLLNSGGCGPNEEMITNFKFELENNSSYQISYRIKSSVSIKLTSGWYLAKTTGNTKFPAQNDISGRMGVYTSYVKGTMLAPIYDKRKADAPNSYYDNTANKWEDVSFTFTTGNDVDSTYKYLSLVTATSANNVPLFIDDIVINKIEDPKEWNFDFEDGTKNDFAKQYLYSNMNVTDYSLDIADETDNSYFAIKIANTGDSYYSLISIPVELKNNTAYDISYRIKKAGNGGGWSSSGWYIGKCPEESKSDSATKTTLPHIKGLTASSSETAVKSMRLAPLYADRVPATYLSTEIPSEWTDCSYIITTGEDSVDETFKYLTLLIRFDKGTRTVCLDDIRIREIGTPEGYETSFDDAAEKDISYFKKGSETKITDDGESNQAIQLTYLSDQVTTLTLPVKVEEGKNYKLQYRYKGVNVTNDTRFQTEPLAEGLFIADGNGNKLSDLYPDSPLYTVDDAGKKQPNVSLNHVFYKEYASAWHTSAVTNTEWITRNAEFTAAATGYVTININQYYTAANSEIKMYLDDIKLYDETKISFNSNGGSEVSDQYAYFDNVAHIKIPEKDGYRFGGWYTDEALESYAAYNELPISTDDIVLHAKWIKNAIVGNLDDTDSEINSKDLAILRKALLGLAEVDSYIADCNADDKVDILDLIRLKKYLSKGVALGRTVGDKAGYQLVWRDEFDGTSVDTAKWDGYQRNVKVEDGVFVSSVTKTDTNVDGCYTVRPTRLTTTNTMNYKYGYIEFKAKSTAVDHNLIAALWSTQGALCEDLTGYQKKDYRPEIDVMEWFGSDVFQGNAHLWTDVDGFNDRLNLIDAKDADGNLLRKKGVFDGEWHTYGMQWTDTKLVFFKDGKAWLTYEFSDADKAAGYFDTYMNVLIGFGPANGDADPNANADFADGETEHQFMVDYVRLYQIPGEGDILIK